MYSGRIDRIGFLLGTLFLIGPIALGMLLYGFLAFLMAQFNATSMGVFLNFHSILMLIIILIAVMWVVLTLPMYMGLFVRRLHDMDQSGWFSILNFVPIADVALYIVLLFYPGMGGENRFGEHCSPRDPAYILFAKRLYQNQDFIPPVPPPIK